MTEAEKLAERPDGGLRAVLADLPRVSAASRSEARHDRELEDGSVVIVRSRKGGECEIVCVAPPPAEE